MIHINEEKWNSQQAIVGTSGMIIGKINLDPFFGLTPL